MAFNVKFWGVRGSIACPSSKHIKYGGNTSCIEVKAGDHRFILDAGTGVRGLGREFRNDDVRIAHMLLTHTHWDHINGFPFFTPAYDAERTIHIMAGHLIDKGGVENVLSSQMQNPMFPVPMEAMKAKLEFDDFRAGDSFDLYPEIKVRTAALNHPNGATGYRIEFEGKSVCYVTDTEHVPGKPDQNILGLIEGADLVIYDCTYTEAEFPAHVTWGHSTWNEGVRLCRAANVKKLAIFHHEPDHDDVFMDKLAEEARKEWANTFVAHESMDIALG
ncbi:MAG: MBL fold metallo-hydrolase [Rhodospirillales bacterium]|nr:MBL fold metallo-hydrolase [Rhodospirillales bacterium]